MTYVGSKGCVMAGDKRSIGFLGDRDQRELLEEDLYSGKLKSTEDLLQRAGELDISIKITDGSQKVRNIGDVLVGEVKIRATHETKRKRIYGTTNGLYQVKLTGSHINDMKSGKNSIVLYGNKITKEIASKQLKKHWKSKISLKEVGNIFKKVMADVAKQTPSISSDYDVLIVHPQIDAKTSLELLRNTIINDVNELEKWRKTLREDMLEKSKDIQMATRIITEGEIGKVKKIQDENVEVILSENVEALNTNWEVLAKPGDTIIMKLEQPTILSMGDLVVIEDENLCVQKNKAILSCDIILCRSEK